MSINTTKLLDLYGDTNSFRLHHYHKGYINFGYWRGIIGYEIDSITSNDRTQSVQNLYKFVFDRLQIQTADTILEVGCGHGMGLIDLLKYEPKSIFGIDINQNIITKAHANIGNIVNNKKYICLLPTKDHSISLQASCVDKVFSVESVQHFPSIFNFAQECKRILVPNGKVIFTTYFSTDHKHETSLRQLLPAHETEIFHPIHNVKHDFMKAGFDNIQTIPIGADVFLGYEKWLTQTQPETLSNLHLQHSLHQNYCTAYKNGYLDYFVVMAE